MVHTFATVMKKTCYISSFHCSKKTDCSNNSFVVFKHNFFIKLLNLPSVTGVELAQQAITLMNHPIYNTFFRAIR